MDEKQELLTKITEEISNLSKQGQKVFNEFIDKLIISEKD